MVLASVSPTMLLCLGVLLLPLFNPAGWDSPILADRHSGALYVHVGDTLHPVLNLTSARLITGRADNPRTVRSGTIAAQRRGPMVGIPGAPSEFGVTSPASSSWLVCDAVTQTSGAARAPQQVTVTVIDGAPDLSGGQRVLGDADAVMLRYGGDAWVIRQGRRSRIDPGDQTVLLLLGLTREQIEQAPPMSRALYDAVPAGPGLSVPRVPEMGGPATFLDGPLNMVDTQNNPVTCWWWEQTTGEQRARVRVVSGPTVPVAVHDANKVVSLVKVDNSGREADRVYFGPGYANFVAGNDPATTSQRLWWLSDSGARFGVEDTREGRSALGLTSTPSPAPWLVLRLLAPGPTLARADALLHHDAGDVELSVGESR